MKENVRQLLETVNDLLRNTEEGEGKKLLPQGSSDMVRICLDIPRAWLVLAAWLEKT